MKLIGKYLKPFLWGLLGCVALLLLQTLCDLNLPNYMSDIVNVGIVAGDTDFIVSTGFTMLGIALLGGTATVIVSLISSRIAAGVAKNIRMDVFDKVTQFSNNEFDKFGSASLITRSTNDVTQIQMLLTMGIRMMIYAPLLAIGGVFMALGKSPSMGWIIALAVVVLLGLIIVVFALAMPKFKMMQKLIDRLNLVTREELTGLMVVRAFDAQEFERERFKEANTNLTKTNLFINRVMVLMMPAMMLIMNGTSLLIVWIGSGLVGNGAMQVGDMMAFMQYAMQIIMGFLMISMMFIFIPRAMVSAARIREVLNTEIVIQEPSVPVTDIPKKGVIEFRDVCFRYSGAEEDVLSHISFCARPGETVAFIGSTGSGKSTLINLIPRFYDVTSGEILLDGINIKDMSQHDLREMIGYVPQRGMLLSGTIASNLKYGHQDAEDAAMREAAEIAQAMEFIGDKENGFDSEISQGGTNVSGGQKQRLSIARALVKQPKVYIFDDCFSALDFKTDAKVRSELKKHTQEATVVMVAQRVSTIMGAEQIFVLDEGKIVGRGTHQELLKSCAQYYEIASTQLFGIEKEVAQ